MKYCYEIFRSSRSLVDRRSAVELLRVVADRRVLNWIPEFFNDPDPDIRAWGIGIIDQLLFWQLLDDEDVQPILEAVLEHDDPHIREQAASLASEEEA